MHHWIWMDGWMESIFATVPVFFLCVQLRLGFWSLEWSDHIVYMYKLQTKFRMQCKVLQSTNYVWLLMVGFDLNINYLWNLEWKEQQTMYVTCTHRNEGSCLKLKINIIGNWNLARLSLNQCVWGKD
jgi:hypothetical protein